MFRRAAALAALTFGTVLTAPAAHAAEPCTWTVQKVPTPGGFEARYTRVEGTDSHGNYSGTVTDLSVNMARVVLWTDGQPRIPAALANFVYPSVADENSAGTVLLSGSLPSTDVGVYLFADGHRGPGTLTRLPTPDGYRVESAVALNERGDVLASGSATADGHPVSILWSTFAAGPLVIDTPAGSGIDLDDDGTVLLAPRDGKPGSLWRHGQVIPLTGEDHFLLLRAIRNGVVVGTAVDAWPASRALAWHGPDDPRPLERGGTAEAVNAHGLIAGSLTDLTGLPAVWQDTELLGALPVPDGVDADLFVVGDDGVVYGTTGSDYGPLRWSCG